MVIVKDSNVIIHLAKSTLLEASCKHYKNVIIPPIITDEVMGKDFPESPLVKGIIESKLISVRPVTNRIFIERAVQMNIFKGEAEVIALYWERHADIIASDDYNLRKKGALLGINLIGTPGIILSLWKSSIITSEKALKAISTLKKVGWFANSIWDRIQAEVNQHE